MIEVEITQEMLDAAKIRADKLGELKNSITRGEGNLAGILGEYAAQKVCGGEIKDTPDYDIMFPDGSTADVKTKRCRRQPEEFFECGVIDFNTTQKCDKYIFVRVLGDYSKAWVLGEISKDLFYEQATFIQQGQFDPVSKWRAKCDCWNLLISELNEVSQITQSDNDTASA